VFKTYYRLTKPGIVYGNALAVIAGFFLASRGRIDLGLFTATLAGISLIIASACVLNNLIDRDIDKLMARTKKRAIASGTVSGRAAIIYAVILGTAGFGLLQTFANTLTALVAAVGLIFYVVIYGWAKRNSAYSTLVGSISGAVPPVVGYTAVAGRLDLGAWLLFAVLVLWQMPHFYAIAIFRFDDYKAAGLPVLPVKWGIPAAKRHIFAYMAAFVLATVALYAAGYTGLVYLLVMLGLGVWWLDGARRGFSVKDDSKWARRLFFQSLVVLLVFCAITSIDWWLP
jgi:protoheme IX farnesyltransferase